METRAYPFLDRFINTNLEDIDASSYAECVKRDVLENIKHILKTTHPPGLTATPDVGETEHELLINSVLNFGIPPFAGTVGTQTRAREFTENIRRALLAGEPRIEASTLSVVIDGIEDDDHHVLGGEFQFSIRAELTPLKHDNYFSIETRINPFRVPEITAIAGKSSVTS